MYNFQDQKRLEDQLVEMSLQDPTDQKLREIMQRFEKQRPAGGMLGGLQLFADYSNPAWYKMKAAEKLLHLRHMERWHRLYRGKEMSRDASARIMADVTHCIQRANGVKQMPKMVIGGLA